MYNRSPAQGPAPVTGQTTLKGPAPQQEFSKEAALLAQGITPQGVPLSPDDPMIPMLLAAGLSMPGAMPVRPGTPLVSTPGVTAPPLVNSHGPYNEIAGGDPLMSALANLG
jgi:hypothetical protein